MIAERTLTDEDSNVALIAIGTRESKVQA